MQALPKTIAMRFRKPMKLGVSVVSWLRHDGLTCEWIACTWRYLLRNAFLSSAVLMVERVDEPSTELATEAATEPLAGVSDGVMRVGVSGVDGCVLLWLLLLLLLPTGILRVTTFPFPFLVALAIPLASTWPLPLPLSGRPSKPVVHSIVAKADVAVFIRLCATPALVPNIVRKEEKEGWKILWSTLTE